jgi:hypothetical protein
LGQAEEGATLAVVVTVVAMSEVTVVATSEMTATVPAEPEAVAVTIVVRSDCGIVCVTVTMFANAETVAVTVFALLD